ncbi:DUF2653 domain-containing protein (plasmid) [Bacillus subtilis]|nr:MULTISPECIES: DUF2653 family protein [Bacillus]AJO60836.1 hypothetical protein QF06_20465 [Bacillus sp. YP1]MCF7615661.1 YxcD family protein [Bacillus subtilis]MDD9767954.1 DUF2653 family protein [Bacillus subtilis]MDD9771391.1 DUF2653 family protein [Bacillus subtilis]MDD9775650.1 DUF2653 family protein [Bacillus subtilis]
MRLILNEQEIVDGICVFISNDAATSPEDVEIKELTYNNHKGFIAEVRYGPLRRQFLGTTQISEGIIQFLEEYHNFNPDLTVVELKYDEKLGFHAEVLVNEGEDQCFHLL